MLQEVTDPDILQKLGGNRPSSSGYKEVTDPDTIKKLNAKNDGWKMPNYPFVNRPPTEQETQQTNRSVGDALKGASQSYINTPEQIANVLGGHLYNKFNYAPKTPAAQAGGVAGDMASYFMPGGALKGGANFLKYVPAASKAINAIEEGVKSKPVVNFLLKGAKNAGEAALFEKSKNPDASAADVAKAGGYGVGVPAAAHLALGSNPLVRTLAGLGVGGVVGYNQGGWQGAAEGAALGATVPHALREIGIGKTPVSADMLTRDPNPLAKSRYEAGKRIGDVPTPAEAFADRGKMARAQGRISHSEEGIEEMATQGDKRIANQKTAINRLLNNIFPNSRQGKGIVSGLYKKAYEKNLTENAFNDLMDDPIISQTAKRVAENPMYQKDLRDVRKNNVAYLDIIKRDLGDMAEESKRAGKGNAARIYGDSAQKVIDAIEKEAPIYKQARMAAERQITRRNMQKAMGGKPITGANFFNKFLANEDKFNELLGKLRNVPQAQRQLKDMKMAWENLVGMDTTKSVVGRTAGSTNLARESMTKLWNEFKNAFGAPADVERAKFIHDPKWWDKFDDVMKYKDKVKRRDAIVDLLFRGVTASGIEYPLAKKADLMVEAPLPKK